MSIMDKIKIDISDLIKQINKSLFHVYKKLAILLSEITFYSKEDQKITDPKLDRLIPYLEAFILMCHLQFNLNFEQKETNDVKFYKTTSKIEQTPQHEFFKNSINDTFVDFFLVFCTNNKKIINLMLKRS